MPPKQPTKADRTQEASIEPSTPSQPIAANEPITPADMKVVELRDALTARGLSPKGLKKELVERLEEVLKTEPSRLMETTTIVPDKNNTDVVLEEEDEQVDYTLEEKIPEVAPVMETTPSNNKPVATKSEVKPVDSEIKKEADEKVDPRTIEEDPTCTKTDGTILHVTGFVRPFAVQSAKDLFGNHGPLRSFWMDSIKSFCFAEFETASAASDCYHAVNGLEFPSGFGKKLCANFSDSDIMAEAQGKDTAVSAKRKASEAAQDESDSKRPKSGKGLDELFKKTVATPHLYYLPAKPGQDNLTNLGLLQVCVDAISQTPLLMSEGPPKNLEKPSPHLGSISDTNLLVQSRTLPKCHSGSSADSAPIEGGPYECDDADLKGKLGEDGIDVELLRVAPTGGFFSSSINLLKTIIGAGKDPEKIPSLKF